jgi:hypothetical protein
MAKQDHHGQFRIGALTPMARRLGLNLGFAAAAILLIALTAPCARAILKAPPTEAQCPRGVGYPDGCASAPKAGSFQRPDFSTYARQSGQTWRQPHPQPWNLAGVDYPVGYSTATRLEDPATAVLPAGCKYQASGSLQGGARVYCDKAVSPTIESIDFSLHDCTVLQFSGRVAGVITVRNNKFRNGSNCAVAKGFLVKVDGGSADFDFEYNDVDGGYPTYKAFLASTIFTGMLGRQTYRYNAILNSPQRPVTTVATGDLLVQYNYVDGWVMVPGVEHGEFLEVVARPGSVIENSTYAFNTMLIPSTQPPRGSTTTFYLASTPGGGVRFTNAVVDRNTVVSNLSSGVLTVASTLTELGWSRFTNVAITDNYVDPTGAYACIMNLGGAVRVAGSVSGRTLTVTSIGAGALYPGATFSGPGLTPRAIEDFGAIDPNTHAPSTGTGGPGTYVLKGGGQSASGTAWRTLDSPISGSLSIKGNLDLRDGSAVTGVGFERQGATCHGHV